MIHRKESKEARKAARHGISLRGLGISTKTEQRYRSAVSKVLPRLEACLSKEELDQTAEDWIEEEWEAGTPLGIIGDALCGLHFLIPQSKGWFKGAWRLYRNWRKVEVPRRAPPMPEAVCKALVGLFMELEEVSFAFLIVLGYHAYLRTGELLKLRNKDIQCRLHDGVVTIRASKTGLRFNIDEAVSIYDLTVIRLWECHSLLHRDADALVWSKGAHVFRRLFQDGLHCLFLDKAGFLPYSLRRGGATAHYAARRSLDGILLRGRWRSLGVARLYLQDGLANLRQLQMSRKAQVMVQQYASGFPRSFLQ